MPSYLDLKAELATLDLTMELAFAREKAQAIREIQAKLDEWRIPLSDLRVGQAARGGTPPNQSQTPKYRDPDSGATWSGRGRVPGWIKGENRTNTRSVSSGRMHRTGDRGPGALWRPVTIARSPLPLAGESTEQ